MCALFYAICVSVEGMGSEILSIHTKRQGRKKNLEHEGQMGCQKLIKQFQRSQDMREKKYRERGENKKPQVIRSQF
jgi:hypothetical protein